MPHLVGTETVRKSQLRLALIYFNMFLISYVYSG